MLDPSADDYCAPDVPSQSCSCLCHGIEGDYDADELGLDPEEDDDA